jgi:hypothetical protein
MPTTNVAGSIVVGVGDVDDGEVPSVVDVFP